MPNWVTNKMMVIGPRADIDAFRKRVDEVGSMVEAYCPLPAECSMSVDIGNGQTMSAFAPGGYETAVELWGTKWGDCNTDVEWPSPTRLVITYETAWSPMYPALEKISAANPTLTFANAGIEEQPDWCGAAVFRAGRMLWGCIFDVHCGPAYPDDDLDEEAEMIWLDAHHEWTEGLLAQAYSAAIARAIEGMNR